MILALLATLAFASNSVVKVTGGVRAYFENGYCSSTGNFQYTRPVAEQYADLNFITRDYGRVRLDMWIISDLTGQKQAVHQRAFYCWEGTLMYGYDLPLDKDRKFVLDTNGGILWDWLNGYTAGNGTPLYWYAFQSLKNPYIVPYWNALGGFKKTDRWTRIRVGLQHDWKACRSLTVSPFADVTWGDPIRFESNYGGEIENDFLGGAFMFGNVGVIAKWTFWDTWYLWARYKQMIVIDSTARDLMKERSGPTGRTSYPIFGIGLGFRF